MNRQTDITKYIPSVLQDGGTRISYQTNEP